MLAQPNFTCILDDDASVRNSIVQLLDSDGLKAQSFEDAEVFFAYARSHPVSLALVDVWMPETSGLQVQAEALRDIPRDKSDHDDRSGNNRNSRRCTPGRCVWFSCKAVR
jgi:CheY-like chemotaxis protein